MKLNIYLLILFLSVALLSCSDDDVDKNNSIIQDQARTENTFDRWLTTNYTVPYNIEFKYRLDDIETDTHYNVVPADYDKAVALAKVIKYLWLDSYDEVCGNEFLRSYVPRIIHLIGCPGYKDNGSILLGTAEGGLKITLYDVNSIDPEDINVASLTDNYLHTMHHEFAHILHQTKSYSEDFRKISDGKYVGDDCFNAEYTLALARQNGFVTRYARSEHQEDFVEIISTYITNTEATWQSIRQSCGTDGVALLDKKFEIVKNYLKSSWNIEIDNLRNVINRRSEEVTRIDLTL